MISSSDPATWQSITIPPSQINPMHPPALAPAVPPSPSQGNAIAANPLSWHQMIVSALVVGLTIWVVEQNFGQKPAFILATVILLGVTFYYKGFAAELQSIVSGKA